MPSVAEIFKTMEYGPAPESDAEARAWLARHGGRFGHFVNGAFTKVGATFEVIDPSTNAPLAKVSQGSVKDVDAAVAAARNAYPKWSKLSAHARARHGAPPADDDRGAEVHLLRTRWRGDRVRDQRRPRSDDTWRLTATRWPRSCANARQFRSFRWS